MACTVGPKTPYIALRNGTIGAFFNPKNLSSLWQNTAGTIPAQVNSVVARMDDCGPLNLMNFTSVNAPILRKENGIYYIEFDGTDDYMRTSSSAFTQAIAGSEKTICVAYRYTGGSSSGTFFAHYAMGNYTNSWMFGSRIDNPRSYCVVWNADTSSWVTVFNLSYNTTLTSRINKDIIYTMNTKLDESTVYGQAWINGILTNNQSTVITNPQYLPKLYNSTFEIGARAGNNDNWVAGRFYGAAIFNRLLTNDERKTVEEFLYINTFG